MRKNSNIIRAFDALTIVKGINSLGGPDKQVYYIESDVYAPDRRITPLLLQPYVNVSDPNGIITAGDKISELVDGAWYVDSIDAKNRVTKSSVGSTLDDPFTIGDNHLLMVRLNTDKSVMLFFEGDYYDSRKGSKIHISLSYMLSTTHNTQNKPAPKVLLSKGSSYTYNPLYDLTELVIESQLADDGKLLRGAVEWCEVEGTKVTPISDAMPYYISGQHSDKLKINPSLMGDVVIRARNLSEEAYNKVYGINPEWDSKMKEVFESRNIAINRNPFIGKGYSLGSSNAVEEWDVNQEYTIQVYPTKIDDDVNIRVYFNSGTGVYAMLNKANNYTDTLKPDSYSNEGYGKTYSLFQVYSGENGWVQGSKNTTEIAHIKITKGKNKATPYTPAPEDLNYRNLVLHSSNYKSTKGWRLLGNSLNLRIEDGYLAYDAMLNNEGWKGIGTEPMLSIDKGHKYYSAFECFSDTKLTVENSQMLEITLLNNVSGEDLYSLYPFEILEINKRVFISGFFFGNENANDAYLRIRHSLNTNKRFTLKLDNMRLINLTEKFGSGNEPSKEQCDEIFDQYGYIPSPQDYAPDGILKGTYQSDMKFTPLYPNIEADVVYLTTPVVKKGVERIKAQAVLSTNKKTITNPEKHFDLKWILKPTTAGGSETVVGTGEFVDIPVANLPEGRVIGLDLDYNFKKQ